MILKEKIQTIIIDDYGNFQKIILLEKIAEDFAIEFAEWCLKNGLFTQFKITQRANQELLEIFKKEKGL
jgi:hypothetical protein